MVNRLVAVQGGLAVARRMKQKREVPKFFVSITASGGGQAGGHRLVRMRM